jgi:repressor LexA
MSPAPLGTTRERVFLFVRERLLAGDPPTVRDVQDVFGFRTPQTARYHLEKLVTEGRLLAARGKARGYRLLEQLDVPSPTRWVPVLGRVQAGQLTTATEELDGYVPMPAGRPPRDHGGHGSQAKRDDVFALRVQGESMTGAGIFPGDLVIVRRQPTADSGALVVALVDDEATVKRLRLRGGQVELHPENPDFEPICTDREITLLGKVIEVRRTLE